eukprot:4493128-Amphidinium_carterae.1
MFFDQQLVRHYQSCECSATALYVQAISNRMIAIQEAPRSRHIWGRSLITCELRAFWWKKRALGLKKPNGNERPRPHHC